MTTYWYCGLGLSSSEPLPELCATDVVGELSFTLSTDAPPVPSSWDHEWLDGDTASVAVARTADGLFVRFASGSEFLVDAAYRTVTGFGMSDATTRHDLLDQLLPRVLSQHDYLMVHASAVDTPCGVVVFLGDSGRGKSTMAAAMRRAGQTLLTDDCVRLRQCDDYGIVCLPTYTSLRLWPDSGDVFAAGESYESMLGPGTKRRIRLGPGSMVERPVTRVFVLEDPPATGDEILLDDVAPAAALIAVLGQAFRLDLGDAEATARIFAQCAAVADSVPVRSLRYARGVQHLPVVCEAVLAELRSASDEGIDP